MRKTETTLLYFEVSVYETKINRFVMFHITRTEIRWHEDNNVAHSS